MPVPVVAVAEDRLVPLADAYALTDGLRGPACLRVLHSHYGHDAFLKEDALVAGVLEEFISASEARQSRQGIAA
jgi:homoserine O-acetyltransferase